MKARELRMIAYVGILRDIFKKKFYSGYECLFKNVRAVAAARLQAEWCRRVWLLAFGKPAPAFHVDVHTLLLLFSIFLPFSYAPLHLTTSSSNSPKVRALILKVNRGTIPLEVKKIISLSLQKWCCSIASCHPKAVKWVTTAVTQKAISQPLVTLGACADSGSQVKKTLNIRDH